MNFLLILYFFLFPQDLELFTSYTINYGSEKEELGLYIGYEVPPIGPYSFSVDFDGNLCIADPVNSSVKIFSSKERKVLGIIPLKGFYDDLTVSGEGEIYILDRSSSQILKVGKNGSKRIIKIDSEFTLEPCKLMNWKGRVLLKGEKGLKDIFVQEKERKPENFYIYEAKYFNREKGYLKKINYDGGFVGGFFVERENIAAIEFLNEDEEGNIYVQIEYIISEDRVGLEVRKISQSGETLSVLQIPENDYFVWTSRLLYVDEKGTVYQVLPKRDFVKINIWK
ncbi:MAG: hypothetical protein ACUVUG_00235 [Candidatus Aminicenantia bacterium]